MKEARYTSVCAARRRCSVCNVVTDAVRGSSSDGAFEMQRAAANVGEAQRTVVEQGEGMCNGRGFGEVEEGCAREHPASRTGRPFQPTNEGKSDTFAGIRQKRKQRTRTNPRPICRHA